MSPVREVACLARRTIAELAVAPTSPEALRELEAHVAECVDCKRVAAQLADVASRVQSAASRSGERVGGADVAPTTPGSEPEQYPLGAEIARGGMGRIYEAWDRRHERRVAVKLLLRPGGESARRFGREARITARLQHPSIVPFYEAGTLPTGEPFFAMKLVDGRSLGQVVAATPLLAARLALLPQLVAVCEALAYAHEQRIVHRDLKPSNVLIGPFGEAVVIDWGLAKELGVPVTQDDETLDPDAPLPTGPTLTVTGAMLGTPSYMAPEQASGGDVDPRTDVYALGALLYHVFAGAPPYAGSSPSDVLDRVRGGPPAALPSLVPELPADLVTIVEKAMARDPKARYATAAEMAADLRRLEAGQLVSAHSYSLGALFARWVERHRATVVTACVLVAALVVTGAVSVRRVVRERDRADAAKALAEHERETALTQRDAAETIVEFMIGELKARLTPLGKLGLLGGVGEKVAAYYRTVSEGGDVAAVERHAQALETLSGVEERKQNLQGAIALSREVVALRERALALAPTDTDAKYLLSSNVVRLGWLQSRISENAAARAAYDRGLPLAAELVAIDPKNAKFQTALGYVRRARGLLLQQSDDAEARKEFELSISSYREAIALEPANTEYQYNLAGAHFVLASLLEGSDDGAAENNWRACLAITRHLLAGDADNRVWQRRAAWCQAGVGSTETSTGHLEAALEDLRASNALRDTLRKSDPEDAEWQREYGSGQAKLCELLGTMRRFDEARLACAEVLAIDESLAKKAPDLTSAQEDVANDLQGVARVEMRAGRPERALEATRRAITRTVAETTRVLGDDSVWNLLASFYRDATLAEVELGRADAALADARASLDALAKMAHPSTTGTRAEVRRLMGDAFAARGEPVAAEESYREALALQEALERSSPVQALRIGRARMLHQLAKLLRKEPARRAEAREALERGIALLEPFAQKRTLFPDDETELLGMKAELRSLAP